LIPAACSVNGTGTVSGHDPIVLFFALGRLTGAEADLRLPPRGYEFGRAELPLPMRMKDGIDLARFFAMIGAISGLFTGISMGGMPLYRLGVEWLRIGSP
jgi:hypothetical protein